jgi:hypothetical protein
MDQAIICGWFSSLQPVGAALLDNSGWPATKGPTAEEGTSPAKEGEEHK